MPLAWGRHQTGLPRAGQRRLQHLTAPRTSGPSAVAVLQTSLAAPGQGRGELRDQPDLGSGRRPVEAVPATNTNGNVTMVPNTGVLRQPEARACRRSSFRAVHGRPRPSTRRSRTSQLGRPATSRSRDLPARSPLSQVPADDQPAGQRVQNLQPFYSFGFFLLPAKTSTNPKTGPIFKQLYISGRRCRS